MQLRILLLLNFGRIHAFFLSDIFCSVWLDFDFNRRFVSDVNWSDDFSILIIGNFVTEIDWVISAS